MPSYSSSTTGFTINPHLNQEITKTHFPWPLEKAEPLYHPHPTLPPYSFQRPSLIQGPAKSHILQDVGYQRTFWVWDFTDLSYYEIHATLLAKGKYSYVFLETSCIRELGEAAAREQTELICNEFDKTIYPRVVDLAGDPNGIFGDIDGDPRIVILLCRSPISYYSPINEENVDYSNLCEMFYVSYNREGILAVVAHEFHHLIWFNYERDEPAFTLEALAQYAMYHARTLASYDNLPPGAIYFLDHPEDSLLYWNYDSAEGLSVAIDYGSAYLFSFYIAEKYGVDILRNLITERADGAQGIETVLHHAGFDICFNDLYLNWITALTIDALGFRNNLYGFKNLDAQMNQYSLVDSFPLFNDTIPLRYYGFHIHKIESPPNMFTVQIEKSLLCALGVSVVLHDTFGWHVYQNLYDYAVALITEHFVHYSVDEAYLITSYLSSDTPTERVNYGLGPLTTIEISIFQSPIPMEFPVTSLIIPLSEFVGISLLITIPVVLKRLKFSEKN